MGTVLAHRTDPDAVGHLDTPDLQRGEEFGDWLAGGLRVTCTTSNGVLLRCEEGNSRGGLVEYGPGTFGILFRTWGSSSGNRNAVVWVADTLGEVGGHS